MLHRLQLDGQTILTDALHPTIETAQPIVPEHGANHLMTSKGNQPTLQQTLDTRFANGAFSPSVHSGPATHPTGEELQAAGLLRRKRGYWVIASRRHHCLDVTLQKDLSRGRTPNSALALGSIRRVVLSLANAAVDRVRKRRPKTTANPKSFQQRLNSARGGSDGRPALIFAQAPRVLDLPTGKDAAAEMRREKSCDLPIWKIAR